MNLRRGMTMAVALGALLVAFIPSAAAEGAAGSANVAVTDSGYTPANVTIGAGGTVTWTNNGSTVHTATQNPASGLGLDSGGLGNGQSYSFTFATPGTYTYTSTTDCLNGNSSPSFNCSPGTVTVLAPGTAAPAASPAVSSAPASMPSAAPATANTAVTITDAGMTPQNVSVTVGGSVTWTNTGANVHSASSGTTGPTSFDTGGLSTGQQATITFSVPGTYPYNSAPDCTNGNSSLVFNCSAGYTVTVTSAAPASSAAPVGPGAAAVPVAPAAAPASSSPVTAGTNISISDTAGFSPGTVTISAGQTVTWTNTGNNVHSVVSNNGVSPSFDSGGLANGQSYSYKFTTPGTYGYHSSIEQINTVDPNTNQTVISYQFNGTVVVQ